MLEGRFSYSNSLSWYETMARRGAVRDAGSPSAARVNFHAERSPLLTSAANWTITQVSGPDLASGASYTNPAIMADSENRANADFMSGDLVGTWKTRRFLPIVWKAGGKVRYDLRKFQDTRAMQRYVYTGGGSATTGAWANYRSPFEFDLGESGASITSLSGGNVFMPDLYRIGQLLRDQPDSFRWNYSTTDYYNTYVVRRRTYGEEVDAGFVMATSTLGRGTFRAGLRREDTSTDSLEPNARSSSEVKAAGYPVSSGIATTVDGIYYQFLERPRIHRRGGYHNYFPSGSFKYRFTHDLDL
jgi:hypothetical protein